MEIFSNFVMKLLRNLISNSFGLDGKMRNLKREIQLLRCRENDVNQKLGASSELQLGRKRKREVVNDWLENVKRTRIEFESLQQAVGETIFYSFSRVQLGRRVERLIEEAEQLNQKGGFSEGLTLDVHETRGISLPTTGEFGQTFQRNCEEVLGCLRNVEILSVGIYGMGGVGKTTVMKHVHNQILRDRDTFGNVYWVTVSQNFSIDRLQNDISRNVDLDISIECDEMRRAACLCEALKMKGKYVLILDDVWDHIPLERVGIPVGVSRCKLILTTRSLDVCSRMDCQRKLKIAPLSEGEAWHLFMEKVGPGGKLTSEVEKIAKCVAKRCAGLPLGIITVAASMRGVSDIHEWRTALKQVKKPTMGLSGIGSEVLPVLEYSYNNLEKREKLQLCFLHCALYPEDFSIPRDELIDYFIVEGLIEKSESRQTDIDMGHTVLNILEKCCLVESYINWLKEGKFVKMHDLIRDMALQILRAKEKVLVKAGLQLREIPDDEEWTEDLKKVSLINNEITEIPGDRSPRCPSLSTLMLQNNYLQQIPNSFFVHLHGLRVLNLCHNSDLIELPNSIGDLANLNALLLRGCKGLKRIPSLGKLRELTDLDLGRTGLTESPQGMEELLHLKCLYMDGTGIVGMIPSGILPRLSRLQSFITWESGDRTVGVGVRAEEVMELKQLEVFQSRVCNLCDYNLFVASKWFDRLWKCRLLVTSLEEMKGYQRSWCYNRKFNKTVELNRCNLRRGGQDSWEDGVLLPRDIQSSKIVACSDIGLEKLHLVGMRNMKGIFKWELGVISPPIPPCGDNESFSSLKHLFITDCPKMKVGLAVNCLLHLPILEELIVWHCEQMEEIIGGGDEEGEEDNHSRSSTNIAITLPKLRKLYVSGLPELKSIYRGKMICDSIQEITVRECRKLKRLGIGSSWSGGDTDGQETTTPFPALQEIRINKEEKEWWESVELEVDKSLLQPFVRYN